MSKRVVIALGGAVLGKTPQEQVRNSDKVASTIADLAELGFEIVITHGNGPQVGMINDAFAQAHSRSRETPRMPLPESGSMTQGYMGYHFQQALQNEFLKRGIGKNVVTLITQTIVDKADPAFADPDKAIGFYYTRLQKSALEAEKSFHFIEDPGKGYRRVVANPKPLGFIEIDTIRSLMNSGDIVIAAGGGGIPVIIDNRKLSGIDAVIDKDAASGLMAMETDADLLLILTLREYVYKDINDETSFISEVDTTTLRQYREKGFFGKGTMLPKIDACIEFVENKKGCAALITSLDKAKEAIYGTAGTLIINR